MEEVVGGQREDGEVEEEEEERRKKRGVWRFDPDKLWVEGKKRGEWG